MKNLAKITLVFAVFAFTFSSARPAKAFYLEVPQSLKDILATLTINKTSAQEAPILAPDGTIYCTALGRQATTDECGVASSQQSGSTIIFCDALGRQATKDECAGPTSQQSDSTIIFCDVLGKQTTKGECPGSSQPQQQNNQPSQGMQGGQQGQPGMQQGDQGQGGPSPEQQAKQLAQMKRGTKQMASQIKQFDTMIVGLEKKGVAIPEEVKQNLTKMKSLVETVTKATSIEELQDADMSEMGDLMQSMDTFRRDVVEKQQRLDGMKRGMKGMEQGLKMFKSQIAKLTKQKIVVPTELTDNIAKLEAIIAQVKTAKTSEEIDAIDFDSLQELMQNLDTNRQQLETLARWPQTLKQMNSEITRLDRKLKSDKTIVDRLLKKGIDLQSVFAAFQDAVTKLKAVRDDAVAKMAAGDSQAAFDAVESDFFGQMEDVWQSDKVIMMMSNLGRFSSDFKLSINQSQNTIKKLNSKKIDTTELQAILDQAKVKGQEVLDMIKSKELDEDTVSATMDELENLRQEFGDKVSELTGQEDAMPWEKGPQQFKQVQMSPDMQRLMPQKQESQQFFQ